MNGPNGFFWLLLAFPIYLLANGKFVPYVKLTSKGSETAVPGGNGHGVTGGW